MSDRWALAPSVDALVDGASERTPMTSTDSKSGARIERVVIAGEPHVLKHVDRADDWLMRQSGDVGCWPVVVWSSGVLDLVPPCVDHTLVGAARTPHGGAVLMRDVGVWMVKPGSEPLPLDQHERFLAHLAAFHAATWGFRHDGLLPMSNRYLMFLPTSLACEAALGFPSDVPRLATEGWRTLARVAPAMFGALEPLLGAPWPIAESLASTPSAFLHGDWKLGNLGSAPDGRTVLVDWSMSGSGPPLAELAHYLALNSARLPDGHTKDDAIVTYRDALEAEGITTEPWWDEQLALCLLGVMLQLGWEKAFDREGDERAWWAARVDEGLAWL
ncbi:MAG: phosphotransferase [Acidimicrobiia bacterium]